MCNAREITEIRSNKFESSRSKRVETGDDERGAGCIAWNATQRLERENMVFQSLCLHKARFAAMRAGQRADLKLCTRKKLLVAAGWKDGASRRLLVSSARARPITRRRTSAGERCQ